MAIHNTQAADIQAYVQALSQQERAPATISKYKHDVGCFFGWLAGQGTEVITKDTVIAYKAALVERYAGESVNSMLAAVNGFLAFKGWHECRVKALKI
ncbi:MAG: site-specific integrase, partial [Gemmiger sp.]|nr:site-specific integrase [Gemmiger sp.]